MKRSAVREHVFRILFRYEFHNPSEFDSQSELYFSELNSEEDDFVSANMPDERDEAEIRSRVICIAERLPEIDGKLMDACVNWKLDRIGKAELSILRLATYEIFYDDEVETPVAINEAVELSKKYCDEKSYGFVNGVLSQVVK